MMRKAINALIVTLSLVLPLALPAISFAAESKPNIQQNLCAGTDLVLHGPCNTKVNDSDIQKKVNDIIKNFINLLSSFVGIIAVVMVMYGGLKYITSGGSDSNVSSAKNTIIYAIVGILVVAFSQYIVRFVLAKATSA